MLQGQTSGTSPTGKCECCDHPFSEGDQAWKIEVGAWLCSDCQRHIQHLQIVGQTSLFAIYSGLIMALVACFGPWWPSAVEQTVLLAWICRAVCAISAIAAAIAFFASRPLLSIGVLACGLLVNAAVGFSITNGIGVPKIPFESQGWGPACAVLGLLCSAIAMVYFEANQDDIRQLLKRMGITPPS